MSVSSQLTWINLQDSSTGIDQELRKRVRSHVTSLQHRKRRVTRDAGVLRRVDSCMEDGEGSDSTESASPPRAVAADAETEPCTAYVTVKEGYIDDVPLSSTVRVDTSRLCDRYATPRLLQDPNDELAVHTRRLGANVPDVLRFYGHLIDRQAPKFRQMSSLPPHNSRKPILIRYLTTHPALLAAASLLVLSHVRSFRSHEVESTETSIVQLRQYAISTMQTAIDASAISDQLVLAVGVSMVYETLVGRPERYHVHAKGLRDMVILRGGMQTLGLGGLVEALIRWYDNNTASINKCTPYLDGLPRTRKEGPRVDREHFLCWVPDGRPQQERVYRD